MRSYLGLAGLVVLAACGGDSSSGPQEPTYPAASGTYAISGGFDGLTPQQANFAGTLTVAQAQPGEPRPDRQLQRHRDRRRRRVCPGWSAAVGHGHDRRGSVLCSRGREHAVVVQWDLVRHFRVRAGTRSPTAPTRSPATGRRSARGTCLPPGPCLPPHLTLAPWRRRLNKEASR